MISVIILTQNSAVHLATQLHALASQEFAGAWEVVVANHRSRDNPASMIARFTGTIPGLRLSDASDRPGLAHALNRGVEEATGDRLVFCHADDAVLPGWLAALSASLDTHEIAGGRMIMRDYNPTWVLPTRPWLATFQHGLDPDGFLPWASTASLAVRRGLHERISGFDENLIAQADQDYCWRASMAGARLVFVPEAGVHHRLPTELITIYREARTYATHYPALVKKFSPFGMKTAEVPPSTWFTLWGIPALLTRDRVRARGDRTRLAVWATQLGLRVGGLLGALRHRRAVLM